VSEVIGYWKNLTEAQKLTQSVLVPGVIDETLKRGHPAERMPATQVKGKTVKWNVRRVNDTPDWLDIHEQLTWSANAQYTGKEAELKRVGFQRVLDNFIADVYGNINNYEAQMMEEMKHDILLALGDEMFYADATYGAAAELEFEGLHALAQDAVATSLNIDNGGAAGLSLAYMRDVLDEMKFGCDVIYMPFCIAQRIDQAYMEAGLSMSSRAFLGLIQYGVNDVGRRVMFFDGIPIIRTDYLVAEQINTGIDGTTLRAKHSSSDAQYSIFFVKFGNVMAGQPGLCMAFGNTEMVGDFYKVELFDKLEDYDAEGIRLMSYVCLMLGSQYGLGRIVDITDAEVTY